MRYEKTFVNEDDQDGETKNALVIRKKSERQGPDDLIHLLTREKQALWEREQNMTLLKL